MWAACHMSLVHAYLHPGQQASTMMSVLSCTRQHALSNFIHLRCKGLPMSRTRGSAVCLYLEPRWLCCRIVGIPGHGRPRRSLAGFLARARLGLSHDRGGLRLRSKRKRRDPTMDPVQRPTFPFDCGLSSCRPSLSVSRCPSDAINYHHTPRTAPTPSPRVLLEARTRPMASP